jgi:hypothetical protein
MRAVIIGTDFIKDSNGGYRVLEINTNTDIHASITNGLDWDGFKNLLTTNGIEELHFMYASNNMLVETREDVSAKDKFVTICDELGIQYFNYELANDSLVVPDVVDSPNKLILRTAYDSHAYVDDSFTKDKIGFNN